MIIDKVHHLLHCLAMSLSYSHSSLFPLLLSRGMKVSDAFLLKDMRVFFFFFGNNCQWGVFVSFHVWVKSSEDKTAATQWNNPGGSIDI